MPPFPFMRPQAMEETKSPMPPFPFGMRPPAPPKDTPAAIDVEISMNKPVRPGRTISSSQRFSEFEESGPSKPSYITEEKPKGRPSLFDEDTDYPPMRPSKMKSIFDEDEDSPKGAKKPTLFD